SFIDLVPLQLVGMHLQLGIGATDALEGSLAGVALGKVGRRAVWTVKVSTWPVIVALACSGPTGRREGVNSVLNSAESDVTSEGDRCICGCDAIGDSDQSKAGGSNGYSSLGGVG